MFPIAFLIEVSACHNMRIKFIDKVRRQIGNRTTVRLCPWSSDLPPLLINPYPLPMSYCPNIETRLAKPAEAQVLTDMSRQLVERGLSWTWKPIRILSMVYNPETVVIVARTRVELAGFAIMEFHDSHAHLNLLAAAGDKSREGIASARLDWLENSAGIAGLDRIELEVRHNNEGARGFYRVHAFEEVAMVHGYYGGQGTYAENDSLSRFAGYS